MLSPLKQGEASRRARPVTNSSFRSRLACALVFVSGCGGASASVWPHSPPPLLAPFGQGRLRSELDIDWVVRDRKTGHAARTKEHLWLTIEVSETGMVVLRAHAEASTQGRLLGTYTTPGRNKVQAQDFSRSDAWKGSLESVGGETQLRLEVPAPSAGGPALEQTFRCNRVSDEPSGEYVHCAPIKAHEGVPWEDAMPPYLRAPLVFARSGTLRAHVVGDHARQSIDVAFTP